MDWNNQEAYPYLIRNMVSNKNFYLAVEYGFSRIVQYLIPGCDSKSFDKALIISARFGNLDCLKILLNTGYNFEKNLVTGLKFAVFEGHLEVVKYLVENGVNIPDRIVMFARRMDVLKYILKLEIHNEDSLISLLTDNRYNPEIIRYLLNTYHWSQTNLDTALSKAVALCQVEMVELIIQKRVRVSRELLKETSDREMLDLLNDHISD